MKVIQDINIFERRTYFRHPNFLNFYLQYKKFKTFIYLSERGTLNVAPRLDSKQNNFKTFIKSTKSNSKLLSDNCFNEKSLKNYIEVHRTFKRKYRIITSKNVSKHVKIHQKAFFSLHEMCLISSFTVSQSFCITTSI